MGRKVREWYSCPMAGFKTFLRWRIKNALSSLPRLHGQGSGDDFRNPAIKEKDLTVIYLFSGTYGDFVQVLPVLNQLVKVFPKSDILLFGAEKYFFDFHSILPEKIRCLEKWAWIRRIFSPYDFLFTNAVGVYRLAFSVKAQFYSRFAYGFRYREEAEGRGYAAALSLKPEVKNFAEENLRLLELSGLVDEKDLQTEIWQGRSEHKPFSNKADILFHIGSAGLKNDFGMELYEKIVLNVLQILSKRANEEKTHLELIYGPGDAEIAERVRHYLDNNSGMGNSGKENSTVTSPLPIPELKQIPLAALIQKMQGYSGNVIAFNSFFAHLCWYLKCPAIILHRIAIPYGYDCSPLHRQVILQPEKAWSLQEFEDLLH